MSDARRACPQGKECGRRWEWGPIAPLTTAFARWTDDLSRFGQITRPADDLTHRTADRRLLDQLQVLVVVGRRVRAQDDRVPGLVRERLATTVPPRPEEPEEQRQVGDVGEVPVEGRDRAKGSAGHLGHQAGARDGAPERLARAALPEAAVHDPDHGDEDRAD